MKVLMCRCETCRKVRKRMARPRRVNRHKVKGARRLAKMMLACGKWENMPVAVSFDNWA